MQLRCDCKLFTSLLMIVTLEIVRVSACMLGTQDVGACLCRTAYDCWYVRKCAGADVYFKLLFVFSLWLTRLKIPTT